MTSLKHYHLGCGESLQSHREELRKLVTKKLMIETRPKSNSVAWAKKVKQH